MVHRVTGFVPSAAAVMSNAQARYFIIVFMMHSLWVLTSAGPNWSCCMLVAKFAYRSRLAVYCLRPTSDGRALPHPRGIGGARLAVRRPCFHRASHALTTEQVVCQRLRPDKDWGNGVCLNSRFRSIRSFIGHSGTRRGLDIRISRTENSHSFAFSDRFRTLFKQF